MATEECYDLSEDKRELILAHLATVLESVSGVVSFGRNDTSVVDGRQPSVLLFDGDEYVKDDSDAHGRGRPAHSPSIISLAPEIYIVVTGPDPEAAAAVLNSMRDRILSDVLSDPQLVALTHNGDMRYEGCETGFSSSGSVVGEMSIQCLFNYALSPPEPCEEYEAPSLTGRVPRERILEALYHAVGSVEGVEWTARNDVEVPENAMSALLLLDGEENNGGTGYGRGRPANGPQLMQMSPELYALVAEAPEEAGPVLNRLRFQTIRAVLHDDTLRSLARDGDVRYEGCQTALALGRSMNGEMGLMFSFGYAFRPSLDIRVDVGMLAQATATGDIELTWQVIDADVSLPLAEAEGAIAPPQYLIGDATIQAVEAEAEGAIAPPQYLIGDATIQAVEAEGAVWMNQELIGDATIPAVEAEGAVGHVQELISDATLPTVEAEGVVDHVQELIGDASLPIVEADGVLEQAEEDVQALVGDASLPSVEADGTLEHVQELISDATLPTVEGDGVLGGYAIEGDATLPIVEADGHVSLALDVEGDASLPSVEADGTLVLAQELIGDATLPSVEADGALVLAQDIEGDVMLPSVDAEGDIELSAADLDVDYLLSAGGGGGALGGGAGGGLLEGASTLSPGSYGVTVGVGGPGASGVDINTVGTKGGNSAFNGRTSIGGGYGGGLNGNHASSGGSGGGGASYSSGFHSNGGAGTSGQGNSGANGVTSTNRGHSGAGGKNAAGSQSPSGTTGGNGGGGKASSITGASKTYSSGGGGGAWGTGTGGSGGTGAGNGGSGSGGGHANGPGCGGGGSAYNAGMGKRYGTGGNGAGGRVVIAYAGPQVATGGTVTSSGGKTIHTFTSNGTFTIS